MKLIRVGQKGYEKPGLLTSSGERLDVSSLVEDYDSNFFESEVTQKLLNLDHTSLSQLPRFGSEERLGSPVCQPSKIICIGLNYRDHAEESGMAIPDEPVVFFKSPSALTGPNDPVIFPVHATKLDWEVELAVVIGKRASYLELEQAEEVIFGYALHNDISERSFQLERGGQWVKGKSCDTFAPLGPVCVSRDEIKDVNQLKMWLEVNGERVQSGSTSTLIFKVDQVITYLSHFMTLEPGDIISMGTPPGVGLGMKPPKFLQVGDRMNLGIEGLGESSQEIVEHDDAERIAKIDLNSLLE